MRCPRGLWTHIYIYIYIYIKALKCKECLAWNIKSKKTERLTKNYYCLIRKVLKHWIKESKSLYFFWFYVLTLKIISIILYWSRILYCLYGKKPKDMVLPFKNDMSTSLYFLVWRWMIRYSDVNFCFYFSLFPKQISLAIYYLFIYLLIIYLVIFSWFCVIIFN